MGKTDITHKSFFENAEWFADLMNAAFFGGEEILDAKELLPDDGAVQKADEGAVMERLRDVVKKHTKDGSTFALYVLENQATVDYAMLIRIMVEESLTYDRQVKEIRRRNKEKYGNILKDDEFVCGFRCKDRLAPVFTLVVYWGDREWDAVTSLRDMVAIPAANANMVEQMRELVPNYRIRVLDLNNVKDFSAFRTSLRTIFEFYSCRKDKGRLKEYLVTHREEVKVLDEESRFLLGTITKEKRLLERLKSEKELKKKEEDMCQAIQEMIDEGREEGILIGKAEGKIEGKAEGKAESIVYLLNQKGQLSKKAKERIEKEKDSDILAKWLLLAASAESITAFEKTM
ncbi:MAG: Rpn family recombination-promoting nuclease/putative transposase [Lachnospiraceae bacterium]|nr:Rpn family recombination-promoting nuclease/putative transposase [Lachnospiraceae bacterium]